MISQNRWLTALCSRDRNSPSLTNLYKKPGLLGKAKNRPRQKLFFALISAAAVGCASRTMTYVGPLTPVSGSCDTATDASLTISETGFIFTPGSGVLSLEGKGNAGEFHAERVLAGADHRPYRLDFTAVMHGKSLEGRYQTPRCLYAVKLARVP